MEEGRKRPIDPSLLALDVEDRVKLARLILMLRTNVTRDTTLLSAIEQVPRRLFLPATERGHVFEDLPIAIECGQTATMPSVLARMLAALGVSQQHNVLEIGTGSGYSAAILGKLAERVTTIERYRTLSDLASERFAALRLANVMQQTGDAFEGHLRGSPFDRILVGGSVTAVPDKWVEHLTVGGAMVIPVGPAGAPQELLRIVRMERGTRSERLAVVRLVPLDHGRAQAL